MTVDEMAEHLNISRGAAYRAVNRGDVPVVRVGGLWLIPRAKFFSLFGIEDEPNGDG